MISDSASLRGTDFLKPCCGLPQRALQLLFLDRRWSGNRGLYAARVLGAKSGIQRASAASKICARFSRRVEMLAATQQRSKFGPFFGITHSFLIPLRGLERRTVGQANWLQKRYASPEMSTIAVSHRHCRMLASNRAYDLSHSYRHPRESYDFRQVALRDGQRP